jgi:hypothetical protein
MLLAVIRADENFDTAARTADAVADDASPTDDLGDAASSPLLTSPRKPWFGQSVALRGNHTRTVINICLFVIAYLYAHVSMHIVPQGKLHVFTYINRESACPSRIFLVAACAAD